MPGPVPGSMLGDGCSARDAGGGALERRDGAGGEHAVRGAVERLESGEEAAVMPAGDGWGVDVWFPVAVPSARQSRSEAFHTGRLGAHPDPDPLASRNVPRLECPLRCAQGLRLALSAPMSTPNSAPADVQRPSSIDFNSYVDVLTTATPSPPSASMPRAARSHSVPFLADA
jgi:hypothetical protein